MKKISYLICMLFIAQYCLSAPPNTSLTALIPNPSETPAPGTSLPNIEIHSDPVAIPIDQNLPNRYGTDTESSREARLKALEIIVRAQEQELQARRERESKIQCHAACRRIGICSLILVTLGTLTTVTLRLAHQL